MDYDRIKSLLAKHEEIENELKELFTGTKERRAQKCSICNQEGHSARTCTQKQ